MARLDALVNWERRDRSAAMRRGLAPIADIVARLGHPENTWRAVHVAGTKGKGTTSSLIAAGLVRAGWKTGLYTSPHVVRVNERIRIDGEDVEDGDFARALEQALDARDDAIRDATGGAEATWFDLLTAAAFLIFAEQHVEWAVIECGLGGRLDSTNVVRGEVCVITNIDLEHTAVLGTTRSAIAREKAGILKRGSALVTSLASDPELPVEDDAGRVVEKIAARLACPVIRPARSAPTMLARNIGLARLVLAELGRRGIQGSDGTPLDGELLDPSTIEAARLPGRAERFLAGQTQVVLDAAHVPSSVRMLLSELSSDPTLRGRAVAVLALGRDKDALAILKALAGRVDRIVCTSVASGPLADADTLAAEALRAGLAAETAADPVQAFARALQLAGSEHWVLVIGSFYLAGAVRAQLEPQDLP